MPGGGRAARAAILTAIAAGRNEGNAESGRETDQAGPNPPRESMEGRQDDDPRGETARVLCYFRRLNFIFRRIFLYLCLRIFLRRFLMTLPIPPSKRQTLNQPARATRPR